MIVKLTSNFAKIRFQIYAPPLPTNTLPHYLRIQVFSLPHTTFPVTITSRYWINFDDDTEIGPDLTS